MDKNLGKGKTLINSRNEQVGTMAYHLAWTYWEDLSEKLKKYSGKDEVLLF